MDIVTKTVTTKVHTAVATPDDLAGVAILAVVRKLGLGDDVIVSSSAKAGDDGSITVEVVEAAADAASAADTPPPASSISPAASVAPVVPSLAGLAMPVAPVATASAVSPSA